MSCMKIGHSHPTGFKNNLLKLFEPRPLLEYKPPLEKKKFLPLQVMSCLFSSVTDFQSMPRSFWSDPSLASDKVFDGKVVLFGGDFRQILPVITNGGREDLVNAMINASYLWENCFVLMLTVNMRINNKDAIQVEDVSWFVFKKARILTWTTICAHLTSKEQERIEGALL
ncbi:ATP-dependent DNA helicase PIF1-like protein [Tanacetum coccineum]